MASKWYDVAEYEGPMSVAPPPIGPQPKKDISSWINAVRNQQAQAAAEAKRIADEQRREQERQRMLAEQRAKVAAQLAKQAEARRAAAPPPQPLQVTYNGRGLFDEPPGIQSSAPTSNTLTMGRPARPVQGPQPQPTGMDAWMPKQLQESFARQASMEDWARGLAETRNRTLLTREGKNLTHQSPPIQSSRLMPGTTTLPSDIQNRYYGEGVNEDGPPTPGVHPTRWQDPEMLQASLSPAQRSQFGLGYGAGGSTPPIGPQPRPSTEQTYGQTVKGNIDFLGDTLEKWVRPANLQFQGMQEERERVRKLEEEARQRRREEEERLNKAKAALESPYRPIAPTQGPGANPPGMLTPEQERKRTEIYQAGSPTSELDLSKFNANLRRTVPGYASASDALTSGTQRAAIGFFDAFQYLDDMFRSVGTEKTTVSDVFGATIEGVKDTVSEWAADPQAIQMMEEDFRTNGGGTLAWTLRSWNFAQKFADNYLPALDALQKSRIKPEGLTPEQADAWDLGNLLFFEEDRGNFHEQLVSKVFNKDEALAQMQARAKKHLADAYAPWVTPDSPDAPWRGSGMTQEKWTETNAAAAAYLGKQMAELKLAAPATLLEANRNIWGELLYAPLGLTIPDMIGGISKAARLTPKLRTFDMVFSELNISPEKAVELLRTEGKTARQLMGQQLIETNALKQLVTQTRSSRALTQADNLFRQTALLFGLSETAEDAAYLVKTLKNNPAALVTGVPKDALTSPRLQALAAEDGLVRFGEWMAAPRLRESQRVLQEIDDDILDALIPGVPVFDVAAKTEAMSNARHSFTSAAMRKYGATKGGVAEDIPMGLFDARAVAAERGTFRVEFRGPSGTLVRTSEPMTKAQAEALTKRAAETDEQTRNVVQKFADVQRKILSSTYLNTRPGHWVRNALSAMGHLFMDDLFSFASKTEIDDYFRRMTGGVEDVTSRLADDVGSQGEHMAGGATKGGNVFSRINQKGREIWTEDTAIPLPGGKSLPIGESINYRKGHYRGHREFMEEGIGRMVRNAPEELRQSPYGPVLLAGLKHAALKNGEKGIADYLAQVETFRLPFVPPASIAHPMESIPPSMWDEIASLNGTAMSKEEWENGLDNIFQNGMDQWQESLRRDPVAMGQRTFTKINAAEDLNERVEEVRALGKRMGLDDQTIEAKQAEVRAAGEAQQAQVEAMRAQLHEAVAATKEPEDLMRAVDMHEDVYEVTERAREMQTSLLREAQATGGREGWMRYEKQIDELWRNTHDEAMGRMQTALDELTGKAPASVRPPRYRLLQRLLETDETQIAKDRQYTRQVGDWGGALQKKIDAQRATIDRALAKNFFVARQSMSADTLDEVFDMHVYLRNLGARAAAEKRAVNIAKQEAIDTLGVPPQVAQAKANVELERIWKDHTDTSAAYIDTVTLSLARKNQPVDAKAVLRDAEAGAKQQVPGNPTVSTLDVANPTATPTGIRQESIPAIPAIPATPTPALTRQQLEDEQFALNAQIGNKVNETVTGNAKQRAAAMAEVDALHERVQAVQKQLDELPADAPAPRPATVRPQPAPTTPVVSTVTPASGRTVESLRAEADQLQVSADDRTKHYYVRKNARDKAKALNNQARKLEAYQREAVRTVRGDASSGWATYESATPASTLKPAAAQGTPAQAINELRTALKDAGIEKPVDAHLVRWVNKNGELGREIKALKEIREEEIPGLVEIARQRTAPAKRAEAPSPEVEDIIKKARQGEAEAYARADEARRAEPAPAPAPAQAAAAQGTPARGTPAQAAERMSKENMIAKYRTQLEEMGLGDADLAKMKRGEIHDMLFPKGLRDDVTGFIADETGSVNFHKWFGLEKGVDVRKAYAENSEAMRRTNAASLTTADIGMYHFRQALHAHEELRKMGDDLFNPKTISRQEAMAFGQWARQQAVPQFRNTLAGANEAAKQAADFAMLNYSNTYGFDDWLNVLVPYHIYRTRTFKNTARRLITRPDHLADFLRTERAIERNNEREGNRPRMDGRIPIPFTDGYAIMNPAGYFYPFKDQLLRQSWDESGTKELSVIDRIMNGMDAAGFSPMPAIALPYQLSTGQEDEIRALLPHTQMLIKLARAMGADVPYLKPNVGTRLLGLTDDWDADRLVRGMAVLQQEGELNLTESQAAWLRDTIAIKTGKAQGPLPEMPDGMEPFFQQVEARAMGDDNVRTLSNFFLGLGIARQPESERQIYRDMNDYFGMQYDPVENPYGSRGNREPTPAAQTVMSRKFFYPDADPDIKRPGIGAATGDFYDERRLLVDQREADIERLFATNPEATYEEEQAIRNRFKEQEAALKARYPSADLKPPTSPVKTGMNPMEGKNAMFNDFLGWFLHKYPGKPEYPGENATWSQRAQWRQQTGAWEAQRLGALTGVIGQAGLSAFLRGRTVEEALTEKWQSEMTKSESNVKTDKRADSRQAAANEAALVERFGEEAIVVLENYPRDGTSAEKSAYINAHPWLPDAWEMREQQKAGEASQPGVRPNSLQDWLGRLTGRPDEINALFDGAKYGVGKDKDGTLIAKGPATAAGKKGKTGGKDDPLRAIKDFYYSLDIEGKCAYLNSDEGAPMVDYFTNRFPDGNRWWETCGQSRGGGGRSYGSYYGGGGQQGVQTPYVREQYMNPELWDLRGLPKYYAPEDRTRFWLAAGDRIGPEQLRAWQPPR